MIRLLYLGLLGQFLISCVNMNDPEKQATYIQKRSQFDKSLVKFFPDRLPNNMLGFGFTTPYEDVPGGLYLTIKYLFEKEYLERKTKYAEQSKYYTRTDDKCLFIVDDYEGMSQEKCKDFYPVPTEAIFNVGIDGKSKTKQRDSEIFFLEFKPGDFVKDNERHARVALPENWMHGYSTGVTTNDDERTIQVWLLVW